MNKGKKLVFTIIAISLSVILSIAFLEIGLRIFFPQETMYPRWQFSKEYGAVLFKNTRMIHERPGVWKFIYTSNQYQYRGRPVPIAEKYDKTNIVVLGDSYSFGTGVNDGEEYSAIIQEKLKDRFNVINLGVGGWGLTQEIRRYYDFGKLYKPKYVILQFSKNDPDDNFRECVTTIENNKFVFKDSINDINWIKRFLSQSIIQKSQTYNLFRNRIYLYFAQRVIKKQKEKYEQVPAAQLGRTEEGDFYNKLLELFSKELTSKGITLIMIAVDDQLDVYPEIKRCVQYLESQGQLKYYYVKSWLNGVSSYSSPEGHDWGKLAHRIIGEQLSLVIKNLANKGDFP